MSVGEDHFGGRGQFPSGSGCDPSGHVLGSLLVGGWGIEEGDSIIVSEGGGDDACGVGGASVGGDGGGNCEVNSLTLLDKGDEDGGGDGVVVPFLIWFCCYLLYCKVTVVIFTFVRTPEQ